MPNDSASSRHHPGKRKANRQRDAGEIDDLDAERILTKGELLLSVVLWMFISIAIYMYWTGSWKGTFVESLIGEKADAITGPNGTSAELFSPAICWTGPLPSYVHGDQSQPPVLHRSLPMVTLVAPCPFKTFVNVARRIHGVAHAWYYVESQTDTKLAVEHHGQPPFFLGGDLGDEEELLRVISELRRPKIGLLSDDSAGYYYSSPKQFLVTFMPEPTLEKHQVDIKYRTLFLQLHDKFGKSFSFNYMFPREQPDWVASEFGVTRFPNVVVHREFPGRPFVYNGNMSKESIALFLEDVLAGCTDYRPRPRRAPSFIRKSDRPLCNAAPLLKLP